MLGLIAKHMKFARLKYHVCVIQVAVDPIIPKNTAFGDPRGVQVEAANATVVSSLKNQFVSDFCHKAR